MVEAAVEDSFALTEVVTVDIAKAIDEKVGSVSNAN